ncbi:MAG TPA: 1,4-alpha-glucan branching enzyme, partial [Thermomicrobiaceae bacterium]|nr:1,4-alpha-glucan branching enzyme [Thermomicrobiaceae bacterium]
MATTLSRLTPDDLYLFNEGTHIRLYDKLGAHPAVVDGVAGVDFAVWAPNARGVSVIGSFNGWDPERDWLETLGNAGIWEGFIPGAGTGELYKFHIVGPDGRAFEKADPFAVRAELPPATASVVWDLDYDWGDAGWMAERGARISADAPVAIYEVHIGSWMRVPDEGYRSLSYRELAPKLADYVTRLGFTHVEFLPIMEHPFFGSWGYQVTGFFAPDSRYGTPQDFMYLIDYLHRRGIGVILDWVPSHFPADEHGLAYFDGTHLYEHADPRQGFHPEWNSYIFNYGRNEVRAFLLSSAFFWLDKYHIDGLRVDAVASMLYLDYSRKPGEWIPNRHGGNENLDAMEFLRHTNSRIAERHPGALM